MRLFLGLLPPWSVRDELVRALEPHREEWPRLRWLNPVGWHLTLSFLGEVPDRVLPGLETRLARATSRHASMTLSLAGAGAFPSARRARIFLTGVRGAAPGCSGWPTPWARGRDGREPYRRISGACGRT
ncbi:RNA 2',3'-cyclic phosphodiesterase [Streptosporangium lutulentum]